MTRQEAIEDLKLLRFNHNVMINGTNHTSKALDMAIEALELMEIKQQATKASDCISRQEAINTSLEFFVEYLGGAFDENSQKELMARLQRLPSVEPEPLSDAYMKAVWTWLLDYQIKVAELKGRYTPYEVLSWVVNDWRKEHE